MLDRKRVVRGIFENIDIEESINESLYTLLASIDVTMALWSSVLFEGLLFGAKAVALYDKAKT